MRILSYEEISSICEGVVSTSEKHDLFLFSVFDTLNKTGLRCNEVLEFNRWTILSEKLFQVTTEKKSNPRLFSADELNSLYSDLLINDATYLLTHNYKSIARKFKLFCPYTFLTTGNKQISTHLFRHRKAKELKKMGKSDEEIKIYLGEKDLKNIQNYINSEIFVSS